MKNVRNLVLAAMFLALGLVMPFLTMQIPEIGSMMCPMHIPVLICGFVCGWPYGLLVGFITPILRSAIFGMPYMMPTAVCMAFELATYGAMAGLLYKLLKKIVKSNVIGTYVSLIGAMLVGRVVWGLVSYAVYTIMGNLFTWQIFVGGAFLTAIPGIIVQLVVIPPIVIILRKMNYIKS